MIEIETNEDFREFSEGYNLYWNFCKTRKGYSGTAIFTKYKPLSV